jgi:hypothetical protein
MKTQTLLTSGLIIIEIGRPLKYSPCCRLFSTKANAACLCIHLTVSPGQAAKLQI